MAKSNSKIKVQSFDKLRIDPERSRTDQKSKIKADETKNLNLKTFQEVTQQDKKIKSKSSVLGKNPTSQVPMKSGQVSSSKLSKEPQTMEELLAQDGYQFHGVKRGDFVEGTVKSVSGREILIDVGAKTEGIVQDKELPYIKDFISQLKPGDKISCYVVSPENDEGQVVLSLRKASSEQKWKAIYEAQKENSIIEVKGLEVNKGGLIVEFRDLHGFIPASQVDLAHGNDLTDLINKIVRVRVVEIDRKNNRLIFSEKAIFSEAQKENLEKILKKVKIGDKCKGKISGVVAFGVFVTLTLPEEVKGMEGLVHISEIAWEKVTSPSDYYKVGDNVEIVILGIEEKTGKLNLSIKKLLPDPWASIAKMYQRDQIVKGKVTRVTPYGVFIEIEKGIEGLLHVSKIPAGREFKNGEAIECMVELVDPEKHRISLSLLPTEKPMGYR